jgi:protein TonB
VPPPKKIQDIRPEFPKEAQAVDLSGIVIVELFLDETGTVVDARLMRPIPMLEEAAMAAVKQWRFQPTIIDGRPVPARLTVTVNFTLQKQ